MMTFSNSAANAYRRVDLDARIDASSGEDLTRICLEEAVASLGQAIAAIEHKPGQVPHGPLSRAHGIAIWLARGVTAENELSGALTQFYGGVAAKIAGNMTRATPLELVQARNDLNDLLEATRAA
ncbi:MAG: hypothetical protein AAGI28_09670 [Pseudomonadota bacterium]